MASVISGRDGQGRAGKRAPRLLRVLVAGGFALGAACAGMQKDSSGSKSAGSSSSENNGGSASGTQNGGGAGGW